MTMSIHSLDDITKKRGGQAILRRLRWIEDRIHWVGSIRRSEICAHFEVSPQQASADLSAYLKLAPGSIELNHVDKTYHRGAAYAPMFPKSAGRFLDISSEDPTVLSVEHAQRALDLVPTQILGVLLETFRKRQRVVLISDDVSPEISHHAIFEGPGQAFLRGWDHDAKVFRSFPLAPTVGIRVVADHDFVGDITDAEWHSFVFVQVATEIERDPAWPLVRMALHTLRAGQRLRRPVAEAILDQLDMLTGYFKLEHEPNGVDE